MMGNKTFRTCKNGHNYNKSSDCPTCPICITSLHRLSEYAEKEILKLHGVGPSTIPNLRIALEELGLSFKKYCQAKDL